MNEHLDFVNTADTLSQAGDRALGAVISKIQMLVLKLTVNYIIHALYLS